MGRLNESIYLWRGVDWLSVSRLIESIYFCGGGMVGWGGFSSQLSFNRKQAIEGALKPLTGTPRGLPSQNSIA
jgi:hypothetical protein